ncbi:MAG TPA: hypothetical protein VGO11_16300 [Chthoniobacteraceae bacterium]|jgi:hypothetical protein|nr:hypothetical protein [Chthoniobacteraceae bacterium]
MPHPTTVDWNELRALAEQAGAAAGVTELLCRQAERPADPATTLFVGEPGVMRVVLEHWLGEEVALAAQSAGTRPLLVAARDAAPVEAPKDWPVLVSRKLPSRKRLVVIGAGGPPDGSIEARLRALGWCSLAVVVTRFGQLLPEGEQQTLAATGRLAGAGRVLAVVLPGERTNPDDFAKLLQRTKHLAEVAGFCGPRWAGLQVWSSEGGLTHHLGVENLEAALALAEPEAAQGLAAAQRTAALAQARQILATVEQRKAKPLPSLSDSDIAELIGGFDRGLNEIVARLDAAARQDGALTETALRQRASELCREWTRRGGTLDLDANTVLALNNARDRVEYVEKLRPGFSAVLTEAATRATARLELLPADQPAPRGAGSGAVNERLKEVALLFGLIFGGGLGCYELASLLPFGQGFGQNVGLMLGAVAGYACHGWVKARVLPPRLPAAAEEPPAPSPGRLRNTRTFAEEILAAVAAHLRRSESDLAGRCAAFIARLADPL